jgi:hypothetical protein
MLYVFHFFHFLWWNGQFISKMKIIISNFKNDFLFFFHFKNFLMAQMRYFNFSFLSSGMADSFQISK